METGNRLLSEPSSASVSSGTDTGLQSAVASVEERSELIPATDGARWNSAVEACGLFDVYHRAEYSRAAETQAAKSRALLFAFEKDGCAASVPILVTPLPDEAAADGHFDAASTYGYPGPLCSARTASAAPTGFKAAFQAAFRRQLKKQRIISAFLRHHPIIGSAWLTDGLGDQRMLGPTIAIDLSKSLEEQRKEIRKRNRNDFRKALEKGVTVLEDPDFDRLETFVRLYNETMSGLGASEFYFFDIAYYRRLKELLGDQVTLFHVEFEGRIIGSTIVFVTNGIVQYHLGGWARETGNLSPLRVVVEHLRLWGRERGYRWVHLGGGVGARDDSLLRFKRGFSKTEFPYFISRIVIDDEAYAGACAAVGTASEDAEADFFPAYRKG